MMASPLCRRSVGTIAVGPLKPGIITLASSIKPVEQGKGSKNSQDLTSVLKKAGAFLETEEMNTLKMGGGESGQHPAAACAGEAWGLEWLEKGSQRK